jgi:hypothetical protein
VNREFLKKFAVAALALTGILHLVLAPEYLSEEAYIGALFIAGGLSSLVVAALIWTRDDATSWTLGALVAGGMAIGFILSRTIGLPGFHESEWELSGIISLLLEAGVVAAAATALRNSGRALSQAAG